MKKPSPKEKSPDTAGLSSDRKLGGGGEIRTLAPDCSRLMI